MKGSALVIFTIFFISLFGCSDFISDKNKEENSPENQNLARVVIPLPAKNHSRSLIATDVIEHTDLFEIVLKNNTTNVIYSKSATFDDGHIEIYVRDGNYDILLLAGDENYYLNYNPLLLASAYVQGVDITLEGTNQINMPLSIFQVGINAPNRVIFGDDFSIDVVVDTKNPLLNVNDFFGGTYLRLPFLFENTNELDEKRDTKINVSEFTKNGNIYTYSLPLTAPSLSEIIVVGFYGYVRSEENVWLYANFIHPDLGHHHSKTIEFVEGAEVKINITWPE